MSTDTTEQMSDAELFASATAPEQEIKAEQPEVKAEAPELVVDGPARDERGRFAPKDEAKPADAAPIQQPPIPEKPQDEASVPSWRARELREQREAAERRAAELERSNADFQRQLWAMEARIREATEKPKEPPDFYADPAAFVDDRLNPARQQFGQEIGQLKEGFSKLMAVEKYGEDAVSAAFAEMEKQMQSGVGQYEYARIMRSVHPFGELVKWHKQHLARQTVGDDPNAWFEKQLEERLKDQAFQGKLVERIRGGTQAQQAQNGSRPNIQLPPSLNKVAAAAPRTGDDDSDMSDASLFRHAMAR